MEQLSPPASSSTFIVTVMRSGGRSISTRARRRLRVTLIARCMTLKPEYAEVLHRTEMDGEDVPTVAASLGITAGKW